VYSLKITITSLLFSHDFNLPDILLGDGRRGGLPF
jgi:hypothetical protein